MRGKKRKQWVPRTQEVSEVQTEAHGKTNKETSLKGEDVAFSLNPDSLCRRESLNPRCTVITGNPRNTAMNTAVDTVGCSDW